MLIDIIGQFATVTGPSVTRSRRLFYALTAASVAVQAATIIMLVPLLERLFSPHPAGALWWAVGLLALLGVNWVLVNFCFRLGFALSCQIAENLEVYGVSTIRSMDIGKVHGEDASKLSTLIATGGGESLSAVAHLIVPLFQGVLLTPLLSIFLLLISWKLAVASFLIGVLLLCALVASQRLVSRAEHSYTDIMRELNDASFEYAWAQPTLRTAGVSGVALDGVLRHSGRRGLRLLLWQIPGDIIFSLASQLGLLVFAAVTGALYLRDEISGVTAAALVVVLLRIVEASGTLSLLATPISGVTRTFRQIAALTHSPLTEAPPTPVKSPPQRIVLAGVSYHYPGTSIGIEDISLSLEPGSITVIVGESGAGKSTLLDVLSGLRAEDTGTMTFDGITQDARSRLARSSVMFQSTHLRRGTIRDNVAIDGTFSDVDLDRIAEQAQLIDVLDRLPRGWDSLVGEGGGTLSGGERQRVGLARALAKNTGLLLCDEATSALDAANERAIVNALATLRGQCTMVIVTHRPALVSLADQVVVLDGGRVAEHGTVAQLRAQDGPFTALWQRWRDIEQWMV